MIEVCVILDGEAPAIPEGLDALLPPWAQQISLLGVLLSIVFAFLRGWVVTRAQNERDIGAERRVSDIWESNATKALAISENLTTALAPVLQQNDAILKAVTEVQEEQRRARERGTRR
jgi:hypothetical protein